MCRSGRWRRQALRWILSVPSQLVGVEPVVRDVIKRRVPSSAVDDLVQATLERLGRHVETLPGDELRAYAITAGKNAAASYHRTNDRHRRLQPAVADLNQPEAPEALVIATEEAATMRRTLASMDEADRELLEAHHVHETSVAVLARRTGRSEMAVRLSLARARAKLRVDYVLAHQQAQPPTSRCRAVLVALSSGDRRAQKRLDVDDHLADCEMCSSLVEPATGKYRPAIALLPALLWWWKCRSRAVRAWILTGLVTTAVVVGTVTSFALRNPTHERAIPTTTSRTTVATAPSTTAPGAATATPTTVPGRIRTPSGPLPSSSAGLAAAAGENVRADGAPVDGVPADEGFWITADDGGRIWVAILTGLGESPQQVRSGAAVSFRAGTVVPQDATFAARAGSLTKTDADLLTKQPAHIEVRVTDLRVG